MENSMEITQETLLGIYLRKRKTLIWKDICTSVYIVYTGIIYNSQDREAV